MSGEPEVNMDEALPRLMELRAEMMREGLTPTRAVLPAHLNPGPYDGRDANPDQPAMIMGLPVTWGDEIGLEHE
jgi:hypothetical protein